MVADSASSDGNAGNLVAARPTLVNRPSPAWWHATRRPPTGRSSGRSALQRSVACGQRVEGAARRRIERRRQLALDRDAAGAPPDRPTASPPAAPAYRGGAAAAKIASFGAVLHRPAEIHHHHLVGDVAHHRQVVADEQIGEPELVLQVHQQVQHLRLDRHVERRDRLVGDHHARAAASARGRSRCAGAGRRRTCADSGRMLGPQPDLAPSSPAPPRSRARRSPRRLISSGSSRIAPTFLRGLSEP